MRKSARRWYSLPILIPGLLVVFFVLFPKGGIKLGDAPITWGYVLIGITMVPLVIVRLLLKPFRATPQLVFAAASVIPFQILFVYSLLQNGQVNLAFTLSDVTGFFLLPALFFLIYPPFLRDLDRDSFTILLRNCIFWAAAFGIFLFVFHPLAGFYIEIPYLTVNAADYGQLELTKHINRGAFLKLISTYNNGNLYGVATLILLPLYRTLEPKRWKRNALVVALVLTLSRTVWAGLIFDQLLSIAGLFFEAIPTFPRVKIGATFRRGALIGATIILIFVGLFLTASSVAFLFDSNLGGRGNPFEVVTKATFLPSSPINVFAEVLYASAVINYGYSGLLAILLIFLGPVLILLSDRNMIASPTRRAAFKGLLLYAMVSTSDGATSLIPVLVFFWFAYMTFLCDLPGDALPLDQIVQAHAYSNPATLTPAGQPMHPRLTPAPAKQMLDNPIT